MSCVITPYETVAGANLLTIVSYLESAKDVESFGRGEEALRSYFHSDTRHVEVLMQAETSFSEIERMYAIFHTHFIQDRFLYFDDFLSGICVTVVKAKVEQKTQIKTFFHDLKTKVSVANAKIEIYIEVLKSLEKNKALLSSALFRRRLREMVEEEIKSQKTSKMSPKLEKASLVLPDCLDLLFRDNSLPLIRQRTIANLLN